MMVFVWMWCGAVQRVFRCVLAVLVWGEGRKCCERGRKKEKDNKMRGQAKHSNVEGERRVMAVCGLLSHRDWSLKSAVVR